MRYSLRPKSGFTLVEMLVVAPFAILLVGSLVFMATGATNSALRSYAKSKIQSDVLHALDLMEQDIRTSVTIRSNASELSLDALATDRGPLDAGRKLVSKADCSPVDAASDVGSLTQYALAYKVVNSGSAKNLQRAVDFTGKWCGGSQANHTGTWQRHGSVEDIVRGADDLQMSFVYDTIPSTTEAYGVTVTLTASRRVAGQDVSYTGKLKMRSINI